MHTVWGFCGEAESIGCACKSRERVILRNWLTWLGKLPKSAGWAVRLETEEELMWQLMSEGCLLAKFLLAQEVRLCSMNAFNQFSEASPACTHYGGLYSKSTNLNLNHIHKKHFTETPRVIFDLISAHQGPANLTHKINYHKDVPLAT